MKLIQRRVMYPIFAVLFLLIAVVFAQAAGTPGSSTDPLVTKSYVDQQIAQLSARIGTSGTSTGTGDPLAVDQLRTDVGDLTKFVIDALTDLQDVKGRITKVENGFIVVPAKKGQKLLLGSGTEAILRSGSATAIKGTSGTLVDVSSGLDLKDAANVPVQHLVISPQNDGRGMNIKTDSYLIIRGAYTLQ